MTNERQFASDMLFSLARCDASNCDVTACSAEDSLYITVLLAMTRLTTVRNVQWLDIEIQMSRICLLATDN